MADLHTSLVAKVTAHLELAQAATQGPWWGRYGGEPGYIYASQARRQVASIDGEQADDSPAPNTRHIVANQPEHVIRVCHADLARLHEHQGRDPAPSWFCGGCDQPWPCPEVRAIAAVYGVDVDQ